MHIVADNPSTVVIDMGKRWDVYNPDIDAIMYTAIKELEPNYLEALIAKWGYSRQDIEVDSYDDIGDEIDEEERRAYIRKKLIYLANQSIEELRRIRNANKS